MLQNFIIYRIHFNYKLEGAYIEGKTSQTITHPENCVVRRSIDIIGEIVERFFFLAVVLFYLKIKLSLYLTGGQMRSESTESKEECSKKINREHMRKELH